MCNQKIILYILIIYLIFAISNDIIHSFPVNHKFINIKPSNIEGVGLFTDKNCHKDEFLFSAINGVVITPIGSKINHSWNPNTYLKRDLINYNVYVKKNIPKNTELTIDYRNTPFFIAKPNKSYL